MFAENGILFPHFQNFSQVQQLEEFCKFHLPSSSPMISTICEYDMGGEGDLFEAPQPFIEEPFMGLDPGVAGISMISCSEEVISPEGLKVADFESLQNEQLFNEVYYECEKDLLEKTALETPLPEVLNIENQIPLLNPEENQIPENKPFPDVLIPKSTSSGCLRSMDLMQRPTMKPSFLDFPDMDFSSVYGMRRAFSEGDIKTLGNEKIGMLHSSLQRPLFSNCTSEQRQEKLSRYRKKKTKRNFGRKIKYACRKALADSQPRIRGRFAKTEESEVKSSSSMLVL